MSTNSMVDDPKRITTTTNGALHQLRCANELSISTWERGRKAIESSVDSLVTQQQTLERIEERLGELGYLIRLRSLEGIGCGGPNAAKKALCIAEQLDFPDCPDVPMLGDLQAKIGAPRTSLSTRPISPRTWMKQQKESSLFSPINMQIVPSPPPSDVFVFGNTPRSGSPRSLVDSPFASMQPSLEAQGLYAEVLFPSSNLNPSSLLQMPFPKLNAESGGAADVDSYTLGMIIQQPDDEPVSCHSEVKGVVSFDIRPSANLSLAGPRLGARSASPESSASKRSDSPLSRRWPTSLLNELDLDCRVPSFGLTVPLHRVASDPPSETMSESIRNCMNIEMMVSADTDTGGRLVSCASEGSLSDMIELPPELQENPITRKEAIAEALVEVELDAALSNWVNFQLSAAPDLLKEAAFTDLKADVQAGAKLIQLLHCLFPDLVVPEFHQDPKTGVQWRNNMLVAFGLMKKEQALRPQLLVNHIVLGKRRAVLDFCWDIVEASLSLKLSQCIGITPDTTSVEGLRVINRSELLCWLQALVDRCNVCLSDFSGSWADGMVLLALVDRLDPSTGHWKALESLPPQERTAACMEAAEQVFSVPKLVQAAQIIRGAEKAIILYVSEVIIAAKRR
eukprot:GGOE01021037.1.p1 GENE.GGOE01021037.1~~GGOE01021037.1.p1  ORF type:complete len:624 (-),score=94.37 GGOE01021037.1:612-2483(-)